MKISRCFPGCCIIVLILIFFEAGIQAETPVEFALAEYDISNIAMGHALSGYSYRKKEPSVGIHDPVFMRVLALKDSKGAMLVVFASDTLYIDSAFETIIRKWYSTKYKQKPSSIIFNASHSHSAPPMFRIYKQILAPAKKMISTCIKNLEPGTVYFGIDSADIGMSRRLPYKGKIATRPFRPYLNGYYDPDLPVFVFYDKNNKAKGIMWSYACHNTAYGRINKKNLISADWSGAVCSQLKKYYGSGFVPIFLQGAAGDIKPRFFREYENKPPRFIPQGTSVKVDVYGKKYADQIVKFISSQHMKKLKFDLDSDITEIKQYYDENHPDVKASGMRSKEELVARINDENLPAKDRHYAKALLKIRWYKGGNPYSVWELQKIKLNDQLQILAHSGEPTSVLGRLVKDQFPVTTTIFLGYIRKGSYMASYKQQLEGGYEAKGYGKDAEQKIIDTFKKLNTK